MHRRHASSIHSTVLEVDKPPMSLEDAPGLLKGVMRRRAVRCKRLEKRTCNGDGARSNHDNVNKSN